MINASAYVHQNRLCVVGMCETELGAIPFAQAVRINGEVADGPVDITIELPPELAEAFEAAQVGVMEKLRIESMKLGAESLVERARVGDQVAQAGIHEVARLAREGEPAARVSYRLISKYIEKHPVSESLFGAEKLPNNQVVKQLGTMVESPNAMQASSALLTLLPASNLDSMQTAVMLCNGPSLLGSSNPRISAISDAMNDEQKKALFAGIKYCTSSAAIFKLGKDMSADQARALQIGYAIGIARRIQTVRLPESPIAPFSSMVAWELGE